MTNTASGPVPNSSSPDRRTPAMDGEVLGQLQHQASLLADQVSLLAGTDEFHYSLFTHPNDMSLGELPLLFDSAELNDLHFDSAAVDTAFNGSAWPGYGADSTDNMWQPLADDPQTLGSHEYHDTVPPMPSPSQVLLDMPFDPPHDQPLASPLTEAPAYALSGSPLMGDGPAYIHPSRVTGIPTQLTSTQQPTPPDTTPSSTTTVGTPQQTIIPHPNKGKRKAAQTKTSMPSLKRSAESTLHPPSAAGAAARPQVLKRYKSDTSSLTLSSLHTTPNNNNNNNNKYSSSTTPTPKTPTTPSTLSTAFTTQNKALGGVLPANVDPRVASEEIYRVARERVMAETHEMSERRRMLLDHEHGALEREMQRLQVNLGRMREAALEMQREQEEDYGEHGAELDGEVEEEGEEIT